EGFAARDALLGRDVRLSDGTEGRCEGVGPGGELRVQTAAGLQSVTSAEVSVRPSGGVAP
ncbi:MAG: biotin--[acetyl-CoA-carboxylase] ligase, partial [Variovorax sp.]